MNAPTESDLGFGDGDSRQTRIAECCERLHEI